ncbi:MAG: gluconolactonase [Paraburkholderia sp.]|uniref:SMP-30/gluconolactonase/LRE family protein n=1 Tax=Paraburkholderia sp. TaxID=1926495 RepID=UPI0011FF6DA4|nr:SMP-30/gluconolactonase/LRE family protein [Paraburkholderia sp.]TAL93154.1 MAG: gluconolactonase [Paraburkholderia sp.]
MKDHEAALFADNFVFLEAPRWHNDRLWVSDVFDCKLYTIDSDGSRSLVCDIPGRPCGIGFLPDDTTVVVSCAQRKLLRVTGKTVSVYADLADVAAGDLNDLVVDEQGRVYVGNFGYDLFGGAPKTLTNLHVVEPNGEIRVAASGLEFPNGAVIKDDGHTLVVAETWSGRLTAFDRAESGHLSNAHVYADLGERQPDGICVDAAGGIWVGCFNTGEFVRVLEGGAITDRVKFNGHAVACALGGKNGKTLFCCVFSGTQEEALAKKPCGAVYTAEVDVPGPTFAAQR